MKEIKLTKGQVKRCARCKQNKPLTDFNICRCRDDKLQTWCRDCRRLQYELTKEHRAEYQRQYSIDHPEVSRKASKKYYETNRDKCRLAGREWARRARKEQGDRIHIIDRKSLLKKNYGISIEDYDTLFEQQHGLCDMPADQNHNCYGHLCVDHNHKTKKVRGLLCHNCNSGIAHAHENPIILQSMIDYLDHHKTQ